MNTQIIKVYYGSDALPYKDNERTVHFPITGSTFLGSSDTTKIRFYVDGYLADENALWISVSKRADGQQGSQFLTSGTDENGDKYREMTLSGWYTEKKGDLYISLKGYQGGSTGYWDEETGMYVVQGVPVIRATGSIKLAINYAPVGEYPYYQDEMASFQDLVAQLGNKLNITSGIVVVSDISVASVVLYTDGQLIYDKATKSLYVVNNGAFVSFFETYDKAAIDTKLDDKVDKLSTTGKYAYTHEGSTQGETQVSEDVVNGAIPSRTNVGQLKVPTTPTDDSHATSKDYVDNSINNERTYLLGVINDAGHSLGLVESTDPSKEYDYIIQLKDKAGNVISSVELDLPLESIITQGTYDSETKEIVLTLDNGSEVRIPVGDLVEGLVDEQGLETALAPYIKEINVSSVLSTNDLLEQVGVEKYFILDNMGSLCLCYISEDSGTYTLNVISKDIAYHNSFTENTLVRNLLGDGTLDIGYLPVITLSQAMQTLTLGEMEIANQDNSIIKYNGRIYHKANETESAIEYVSADYDIANGSTNTVITKYEISVNKSTRATTMISQNLNVYSVGEIDSLLNEKANTSGDYPLLTVGKSLVSEQIENINDEVGSTQTNPFLFQGTGTNDNTTETPTSPVAKHLELRGNSVVWKQLVDYQARTIKSVVCSFSNGIYTLNGTASGEQSNTYLSYRAKRIAGHKYLWVIRKIGGTVDITGRTTDDYNGYGLGSDLPNLSPTFTTLIDDETTWQIVTGGSDSNNANYFRIVFDEGVIFDNAQFICMTFDLTSIYGAGKEPTTYLQFVRDYPLPYYEYNTGELKSCNSSKLVTIGYNAFNNEWDTQTNTYAISKQIKVIAGQKYTLEQTGTNYSVRYINEYDGGGNLIKKTNRGINSTLVDTKILRASQGLIVIQLENNTQFVTIRYDFTVIPINIAFHLTWDNSKTGYELYVKHEYDLPSVELRSVGSVYDTITPNGVYTQRIGVRAYESGDESDSSVITDLTNTYYVLETPIVSEVSAFAENIEVDDFGTMEFVPSDSTEEVIIPQGNKFFYPADYVLFIDDLYNRSKDGGETSDANNFVTQSELEEAVGDIDLTNYVDLTSQQTINSIKTFDTALGGNIKIVQNGVEKFAIYPDGNTYNTKMNVQGSTKIRFDSNQINFYVSIVPLSDNSLDLGNSSAKWRNLFLSRNLTDGTYTVTVAEITKKPSTSYSLSDGGTITDNNLKSLIQNEQPIKLNGFTCYFSCDDGTNYQYVNTRYDSNANTNHINVITINKSTWVATFHTSDIALS